MSDESDRIRIHELISLHGHLMDEGDFNRLGEVFVDDVIYDVSALGGGQLVGAEAISDAGRALDDRNPLGHHVTNVVVVEIVEDHAQVRSKGLAVMSNGAAGSVVYDDELRRTDRGWRSRFAGCRRGNRPFNPRTQDLAKLAKGGEPDGSGSVLDWAGRRLRSQKSS